MSVAKKKPSAKSALHAKYAAALSAAHDAGTAAATGVVPTPMIVGTPRNMMGSLLGGDDGGLDPAKPIYRVDGGVCGFAWIVFTAKKGPEGSEARSFLMWAKGFTKTDYSPAAILGCSERLLPSSSYYGISMSVMGFGQSMTRKESYAAAFSRTLNSLVAGMSAYPMSRMD